MTSATAMRSALERDDQTAPRWMIALPPIIVVVAWAALSASGVFPEEILVSPLTLLHSASELWANGELPNHLGGSLIRLGIGYGLGALIGITLGTLMGVSAQARAYLLPSFHVLRQLPTIALIPAFIMLLGVGETVKIVLVAKATALPVALATLDGVRGVPRTYLDVGRLFCVGRFNMLTKVVAPAVIPPVITGLRIALARSWMVLVGAELLVADSGIGQMMEWGRQAFRLDVVLVGVVLTGLIGFALDKGFRLGERVLLPAAARGRTA